MSSGEEVHSIAGGRRGSIRQFLAPMGAAAALSFTVAAIYAPIGILVQSPANAQIYGGGLSLWVLASAIGMVPLIAVFALARARVSRVDAPAPIAVLGWYAVAALAQAVTFGFTSVLLGLADSPDLSFRISGLLLQVPLLAIVGFAVTRYEAHRQVIIDLEQTRERLLEIEGRTETELERADTELTAAVRKTLDPAVATLEAALANAEAGGDGAGVLSALDEILEERVRPLTRELASEEVLADDAVESSKRSRARVPLPARFRLSEAIRPTFTALLLAVVAIPTAARVLQPANLLLYIFAFCLSVWLILWASKRVIGGTGAILAPGMIAIVCLYAAAGLGSYLLIGALGVIRPASIEGSVVTIFAAMGFVFTAFVLVEARRTISEGELEADTMRLDHAVGRIRRRERLVSRRLNFIIHGALQGALNAAALRIAEAGRVTSQLGDEIRSDIRNALSQVEVLSPSESRPQSGDALRTSTTISEISSVWSRRRRFGAQVGSEVEQVLSANGDADEAVAEVIREAVNNAFRHGAATRVEVAVTEGERDSVAGPSEIAISVRDDGVGPYGSSQPGIGSSLFDDLCRSWTLERSGRWTLFWASVESHA